ncbi:MAG TPA: hypothetical protein VEA79_13835 [Phenylobacterium sp.]|nr:hypothetical protein [Phenylobacterium sp.]
MKKTLISIAAVSTLAAAAVPAIASAAPWQNINQRQANLDRRIDQGVRNHTLTAREAQNLRNEFRQLVRLEDRYRRGGLNNWERADLNRRFDALSARIRIERNDRQDRRYGYGYGHRN